MTIRLSIVIPIYNSKKYLKGCLNSVCQQIKQDVEIILINDCSTDGSIKICEKFVKKYNFVKLVNLKKNKGVGHCRNIGIKKAMGEYICFVDSDDKLLKGSINNVLYHIKIFYGREVFVLRYFDSRHKKVSGLTMGENQIFNLCNNSQNFTINELAKKTKSVFSNCKIMKVNSNFDKRNYKVSSNKIKEFINFESTKTVEDVLIEFKKIFEEKKILEAYQKKFSNFETLINEN